MGNEDLDQFWFMVKALWEAQGVTDDKINKDYGLTWYIKHSNDNPNIGITDIQATLNNKFSKPKSEA